MKSKLNQFNNFFYTIIAMHTLSLGKHLSISLFYTSKCEDIEVVRQHEGVNTLKV